MSKILKICIKCKRTRYHYAKGLCASCYVTTKYPYGEVKKKRNTKWRLANMERCRYYANKWWKEHPEKYEEHKQNMRKKMRKDYKENPKKFIKRNKKWRDINGYG